MANRRPSPREIAFWRYQQIEEALDELDRHERARFLLRKSRTPACWPTGKTDRISKSTLYRWLAAYRSGGLEALQPKSRRDKGKVWRKLPDEVVEEALRLLGEDPGLTYTLLIAGLEATFEGVSVSRSTLQRRLAKHPGYKRIQRSRRRRRRRGRFVARAPHDIWHCDAKGPVRLRLTSGKELTFHVLSILDDATRAVLAAIVALRASLAAAVLVFRMAALRWGLPKNLYADRASIFDSHAFRMGLAGLGSHRIRTKARNAEAHGKIEAYHRVLVQWFTDRLVHQKVVDLVHLQQLLDGIIGALYQTHYHRAIKTTPEQALSGQLSPRAVPPTRLYEAFRQQKRLKAHPKTGEVEIDQTTYLVPDELRGNRLTFLVDPPRQIPPLVVHPESGEHLSLRRAAIKPEDLPPDEPEVPKQRWGAGILQAIYDKWCGNPRPVAEPGFGLPELYALLGRVSGRHVPASDQQAALVQRLYREHGPWTRRASEAALGTIANQLGPGRPIKTYLDALIERVEPSEQTPTKRRT
jgi:transposase InsO family protein